MTESQMSMIFHQKGTKRSYWKSRQSN